MNIPQIQPKTKDKTHALAIERTVNACDIASLGESCIDELRSILRAIVDLSKGHEVIYGLAKVGFLLAEDRHNLLDCERENMQQKLLVLKGASHD